MVLLQWLKDDFLGYLDDWENSVQKREGFSNKQKSMMLMPVETRQGIRVTGI